MRALEPVTPEGEVAVRWGLTTHTWGLFVDVYRGNEPDFELRDGPFKLDWFA